MKKRICLAVILLSGGLTLGVAGGVEHGLISLFPGLAYIILTLVVGEIAYEVMESE